MYKDLLKIKKLMIKYIYIIKNEYKDCNIKNIEDIDNIVTFNEENTITFWVRNGKLLLPTYAYKVFPYFKSINNYGKNKNNYRKCNEYLDTNTSYSDYINHIIECSLNVYDYFEESLLHETMHICGSGGGYPLEEGINELKTRELAQKYNIKIAAYGYSKEVEVAIYLQNTIGKNIMDELTFIDTKDRYDFLYNKVGKEKANLYIDLFNNMNIISKNYYDNLSNISNPYEKAKLYDENVNYSDLIESLCVK